MSSPNDPQFLTAGLNAALNSGNLKTTITELVTLAAQAAGTNMGALYMLDSTKRFLQPYVLVNMPEAYVGECGLVEVGTQCCGRAVAHRRPWIVSDMLTDPLFAEAREASVKTGIQSAFSVPVLTADGEPLGSLSSHFYKKYTPSQYMIERNRLFATLIAFAIAKERAENSGIAASAD